MIFVGQGSTAVRSQDDGDTFTPLAKPSRAGFHGIVPLGDGRYVVTGDGGSRVLANTSGQSATNGETPQ